MSKIISLTSVGDLPIIASSPRSRWRDSLPLFIVYVAAIGCMIGILTYANPAAVGTSGFWVIVQTRLASVGTIALVAVAQSVATVLFHTVTSNRILTPSILGFDALYVLSQTALVFVFGTASTSMEGIPKILAQSALMVIFAAILYSWLFSGSKPNLHLLLLIGVVLGIGFGSISTFLQRMLTPGEFDVLSAKLFGSISKGNTSYLPIAALIVFSILVFVWMRRRIYDVVALGREVSLSLGIQYRREVVTALVLVAILVSVSATMVGPMTFFGFLVATLAYQFARGDSHAHVLPLAIGIGLVTLLGSTFVLRHIFSAAGLVTVIIEFVGGLLFLIVLLRKGMR